MSIIWKRNSLILISADDALEAFENVFGDKKEAKKHLNELDKDDDGKVTSHELFRYKCLGLFNYLDADGSGSVTVKEIEENSELVLGMKKTTSEAREALAEMDKDGTGVVEFNEFFAYKKKFGGFSD